MTKSEMFTHLQGLPNYGGQVGSPEIVDTNEAGDNKYRLTVRVVDGYRIQYQHLYFWVIDDGGASEDAYYEYRDSNTSPGAGFIELIPTS